MKLPLFVATKPSPKDSPLVLLDVGEWTISSDHSDSSINLSVGESLYTDIRDGLVIKVESPSPARAGITLGGSENNLTLYLCHSH